jgi:hypothetical protein|nr:MAG TPA: hypothetical protein [Caudoviricetes sp.]
MKINTKEQFDDYFYEYRLQTMNLLNEITKQEINSNPNLPYIAELKEDLEFINSRLQKLIAEYPNFYNKSI